MKPVVVDIGVVLALADIGAHSNGVQHKVHLAAEMFHGLLEQVGQILDTRRVRRHYRGAPYLLCEFVNFAHAHGHRCIGQHQLSSLGMRLNRCFPSDGLVVQSTENDALFPFQ